MSCHFPLWCVIPKLKPGERTGEDVLYIFSAVEKLTEWLEARRNEYNWYIRLLTQDSAHQLLNDLRMHECAEIVADLNPGPPQKMPVADFVIALSKK